MVNRGTHLGVVVGVDGSPGSAIAVQWAAQDAALRGVPLTLVHAARTRSQRERGQQLLDEAFRTVRNRVRVRCEIPCATPVFALTDLSEHADLMVVGCPGSGTTRQCQLCSVSSTLIHHAHCPVAVVHDDIQLSPESLSAPVLVALFLTDVSFGALGKMAQQIQVHSESQPVKSMVGLGMLLLSIGFIFDRLVEFLMKGMARVFEVVEAFR